MTQEQRQKLISTFSRISWWGDYRISTGKTPYFSFSWSFTGIPNIGRYDVYSFWHADEIKSIYTFKGITHTLDLLYSDNGVIHYELTQTKNAQTQKIESADILWQKDQKKIDLKIPDGEGRQRFIYTQTKEDDFTVKLESSTGALWIPSIPLECQWNIWKIKNISCNIILEEKDKVSLQWKMSEGGDISGNITTPSGSLDFEWYIRKDDFLVTASIAWVTATLANKKSSDGSYVWKLQLPVATVKWTGKVSNEILSDFHIGVTSPAVMWNLDLIKKDDHVEWPFSMKIQGQEVSSGTIMMRSIPKYFDFRLDTNFTDTNTPWFIELHKFTDTVWDPSIHLEEPVGAESILSGSELEKIIQGQSIWEHDKEYKR